MTPCPTVITKFVVWLAKPYRCHLGSLTLSRERRLYLHPTFVGAHHFGTLVPTPLARIVVEVSLSGLPADLPFCRSRLGFDLATISQIFSTFVTVTLRPERSFALVCELWVFPAFQ